MPSHEIIDFRQERDRHEHWFGREDLLGELDRLLPRQYAARGWVLIKGGPGMGKSALLSRYLQRLEDSGEQAPHHFLRHGVGDWDQPWRVVGNLAARVAALFGLELRLDVPPEERLREVLQRVSDERLKPEGRRLLLVVDGLDEAHLDARRDNPLPRMLPHVLPRGVQVLCASRHMYPFLSWLEQLERVRVLDLDAPRWADSNEAVVRCYWEDVKGRRALPLDGGFVEEAVRRARGNLLYTVKLVEWLEEQPPRAWRVELLPGGLDAFLTQSWERLRAGDQEALEEILTGLGLVVAARESLPQSRLEALAGWTQPGQFHRFLRNARPFLLDEPESWWGEKAWRPFHESFRAFVVERLDRERLRRAHLRLAEHLAHWPVKTPGDSVTQRYAARYGVLHRLEGGDVAGAASLCRDMGYLEEACRESRQRVIEEVLPRAAASATGDGAETLRAIQRALQAEAHGLTGEPGALPRRMYNRLLSSGWPRERIEASLHFPNGLPSLRLRHPVRMGGEEDPASGHEGGVRGCAMSADGHRILSASEDATLKVWDVSARRPLVTLRGHTGEVWSCAMTRSGHRAVSASLDGVLKVWEVETGRCVTTLYGHSNPVSDCALTEDGGRILSASSEGTVKFWDVETRECLATLRGHAGWVSGCAVFPEGHRAISVSHDKTLRLWDLETSACLATLRGHSDALTCCALSRQGHRAISGDVDGTLIVWDLETGERLATLQGHTEEITSCAMTDDGLRAISVANDGTLKEWDARSGVCLATFDSHLGGSWCCAMTGEGHRAVCGSSEGTLKVWDLKAGQELTDLPGRALPIYGCAVTEDGRRAFSASWDGVLRVWDVRTHRAVAALPNGSIWVMDCAATGDGRRAVSASWDGTLRVWDVEGGRLIATLPGHAEDVRRCAVTEDGRRVLSASSDGTLKLWDVETRACLATFQGHETWVNGCAMTEDGRRVLSASSDGTLKLWDVETRACLFTLAAHERPVGDCAITADGRRAVSASEDGTLKVWDVETRRCVATLQGHTGGVIRCVLSKDGRQVFSVSSDGSLRHWEVDTQRCLDTLWGSTGFLSVAVAGNVVCAGDKRGNLWMLEALPARAARDTAPGIELAILIALREEFQELLRSLSSSPLHVRDELKARSDFLFDAPRSGHRCVVTLIDEMGLTAAALQAERLMERWNPRVTVMLGIAAGIHDDVRVGDVVVADQVDHYLDRAKALPGQTPGSFELVPGGSVYRADHALLSRVRDLEFAARDTYQLWQRGCATALSELLPDAATRSALRERILRDVPELHVAHLASGDIVGASQEFSELLRRRDRNLKALDMESAGMMAAAVRHATPRRTLILRGISDFGDARKADLDATGQGALRGYAMRNATALLWALLEAGLLAAG